MIDSTYITDEQFQDVLKTLDVVKTTAEQQDILDRAVGEMEGELCERFVVPLRAKNGGPLVSAPAHSQMLLVNAVKAKVRQVIGGDAMRNIVIESTQRLIDGNQTEFKRLINILNDPKKDFGLKLTSQASGSMEPVQKLGLGRADNRLKRVRDPDAI